jgi:hypothetical protein
MPDDSALPPQDVDSVKENQGENLVFDDRLRAALDLIIKFNSLEDSPEENAVQPEILAQQVVPPIENDQLPDDFVLPLPSVDVDSAKENQGETFVIDDKVMAMLNPMIAEFYSSGEFLKEGIDSPQLSLRVPQMEDSLTKKSGGSSKFNWEPLEHLVESTLKMKLPEAEKEICLKLDPNQRAHFSNMPDWKKPQKCQI